MIWFRCSGSFMVSSSPPLLSVPSPPTSLSTMKMKKQGSSSTGLSSSTAYSPSISNGYSTPPTSVSDSHRWSEVIPPKTALTFAVVWDPDADMVAFSGAHFLDAVDASSTSPTDAYSVAASSTLRWFQDNHEYLFSDDSSQTDRAMAGQTQTSSLLMQPDIEYHRRSRELGEGIRIATFHVWRTWTRTCLSIHEQTLRRSGLSFWRNKACRGTRTRRTKDFRMKDFTTPQR
ncbi:hypothetical protein BDZ89DRAFT_169865 [Hymenopellis radicata]|nr:hypothetical protein BDZ89DRAFT_169865 [Hymenopellis radicata]